jgi:hypothetical protein
MKENEAGRRHSAAGLANMKDGQKGGGKTTSAAEEKA